MSYHNPNIPGSFLLALGANLPFGAMLPNQTLQAALDVLEREEAFRIKSVSRFWRTPAFPAGAGPDFVNAAALVSVPQPVDVASILAALHRVEARFGRERRQRWGGRTLDLDLLAAGDSVLPDSATQDRWRALPPDRQAVEVPDRPILPHPRLADRAFVLVPLAEVAPGWRHPRTGLTVHEMLEALPARDRDAVIPL
ncbi:MAG: 2-amino-4-hydroxy-6-hydroxymethyldihydropteridine diphosphokinase [Rhodobacteraceae bacterium]|jgi:2-amino-4-hydroxy-6-hydroxymethyldihydropteridine diphosphokinase|nr:2-amino-4-hydroxy-6-hydroxymethyldihydropteridine diphosphokinase [Paracoccaceae bacterium]